MPCMEIIILGGALPSPLRTIYEHNYLAEAYFFRITYQYVQNERYLAAIFF